MENGSDPDFDGGILMKKAKNRDTDLWRDNRNLAHHHKGRLPWRLYQGTESPEEATVPTVGDKNSGLTT